LPDPWAALAHARASYVLARAGVDALVIKGPTIASWLYPDGRESGDVDLLVAPSMGNAARDALTAHGYTDVYAGVHDGEVADHSYVLTDDRLGGREVDVHVAFPGVGVDAETAWRELWARRSSVRTAGIDVPAVDRAAVAVLLLLHAARNGAASPRAVEDVRLVAAADDATWREVAGLVERLCAAPAVHAALGLVPDGERAARALGIAGVRDPDWELRASSPDPLSVRLLDLRAASWRRRVAIVARELAPSAAFLRATRPVARRGAWGLPVAYVQRLADIARRLPGAWRELRRHS
jgi:hypothetical protein